MLKIIISINPGRFSQSILPTSGENKSDSTNRQSRAGTNLSAL